MTPRLTRRVALISAGALMFSTALVGASQAETTLTFLVDNADASVAWAQQLVTDFEAQNPDIKISIETRPGGTDGDNIVKTRLATGEMTDIFNYNAGSLFQAINPQLKFNNSQRGYAICDVTPKAFVTEFKVLDAVTRKDGKLSTRAKWALEAGKPGIVQA